MRHNLAAFDLTHIAFVRREETIRAARSEAKADGNKIQFEPGRSAIFSGRFPS